MPATSPIALDELKTWIDEKRDFVLIDTSIPESFREARLPTAQGACVFEVTFLDQVQGLHGIAPTPREQRHPIVVYGSSSHSLASATAAEKLEAAGYRNLYDYKGGVAEWREAGFPLEGEQTTPESPRPIEDRVYAVDAGESILEWTGRSLASEHCGTIAIASGEIVVENGLPARGEFILDMDSIANTDQDDLSMRSLLARHLKSDDFFDVARFPRARFVLLAMEPIPGATPGRPNYHVRGRLQLKAVDRELDFPALICRDQDGTITARTNFDIDRTLWNVRYGSGKFYENLGMHLVCDLISLDIKIVAR